MPVHHRAQVGVAPGHGHVRDVRAPDLVGPLNVELPQQVGILAVGAVRGARPRPAPDRLVAHLTPQAAQALPVHLPIMVALEHRHQAAASQTGIHQVNFIQKPLQLAILLALPHRFEVGAKSAFGDFQHFMDAFFILPYETDAFSLLQIRCKIDPAFFETCLLVDVGHHIGGLAHRLRINCFDLLRDDLLVWPVTVRNHILVGVIGNLDAAQSREMEANFSPLKC